MLSTDHCTSHYQSMTRIKQQGPSQRKRGNTRYQTLAVPATIAQHDTTDLIFTHSHMAVTVGPGCKLLDEGVRTQGKNREEADWMITITTNP